MPRKAHHRGTYGHKPGRRKPCFAMHLAKVLRPTAAGARMADSMVTVGTGIYRIPPARVLEWRAALEDALPYLRDEEGRVWQ